MAFNQFKTLDEKIQYVLENHDRLMQERHQKANKKIKEYNLNLEAIYSYGKQQDLKELRVIFSNLKHRYKYHSLDEFLTRHLNEEKKKQAKAISPVLFAFYIAMMEEVCNRHSLQLPDFIREEKDLVLPVYFADPGCYAYDRDHIITKESIVDSYEEALPIFKRHNLLIGDIDDVF